MFGSVIFLIGIAGGSILARKYMLKIKTKYSPETFKKYRLWTIPIAFLIEFVGIVLGLMLGSLVEDRGLQVVTSLKLGFIVWLGIVAMVLITQSVNILFERLLPSSANKNQTISVKKAWLLLLVGLLVGVLAYILLPIFL